MSARRRELRRAFAAYLESQGAFLNAWAEDDGSSRATFERTIAADRRDAAQRELQRVWPTDGGRYTWAVVTHAGRTYVVNLGTSVCYPAIELDLDDG